MSHDGGDGSRDDDDTASGSPREKGRVASRSAVELSRIDRALEAGRFDRALEQAERGLARRPDDGDLQHARGVALRGLGRAEDALEAFVEAIETAPTSRDAWLDAAELLIDDVRDDVRALDLLHGAARQFGESADLLVLRGVALAHLEDLTGALAVLDRAVALAPRDPDALSERAGVLIELLRSEEAESALREAIAADPAHSRAHHLLGFLLDWTGRREEAATHFRRAGECDPSLPRQPPRLSETEFDAAIETALAALPTMFREALGNVEIGVENYADRDFCRRHDCSPTTLGLYVGTPITQREAGGPALPDRIVLFQRALENQAHDLRELRDEIVVTLKHEVGHHLGFEEDDLARHGYD